MHTSQEKKKSYQANLYKLEREPTILLQIGDKKECTASSQSAILLEIHSFVDKTN
jgi:hypothetical protein